MLTILEKPFVYARKLGKKSSAATTSSSMTIGGNLGSFLSGGDDSDGQNGPAGVEDVEAALGHPGKDGGGRSELGENSHSSEKPFPEDYCDTERGEIECPLYQKGEK